MRQLIIAIALLTITACTTNDGPVTDPYGEPLGDVVLGACKQPPPPPTGTIAYSGSDAVVIVPLETYETWIIALQQWELCALDDVGEALK